MRVDVFSRHDAFVGSIAPHDLREFVHTDELNGEDSVAVTTSFPLREGQRLVWKDRLGRLHEHVCQDPQAQRGDGGEVVYSDTALNSICELFGDYIEDADPAGTTFFAALRACLAPTRWEVGTVDQTGSVGDGLAFRAVDCRSALNSILEFGGELETEVSVSADGIMKRRVGIRAHRGQTGGHRRFSYGKDLVSMSRTEHWGAITACYGYGKGLETGGGGDAPKLTFGSINGGRNYVEDAEALERYGRPDGKGGLAHVFGSYEDSECEDAARLMEQTRAYLDAHKTPGVTYEADVIDLVAMGRQWEGVGVGDDVQIVDSCFDPPLRCEGRVSKLVTDMLGGAQTVTLGNVTETLADILEGQQQQLDGLSKRAAAWDVAAYTPGAYLQQIIDGLNERFNMQNMSYCHTSFEKGTVWASVPMDEDGRPLKAGGSAIQICSEGFRIASGTKPDGDWDWATFGTGEGFTAHHINAGTLAGGSSFFNLDTGDVLFKQGTIASTDGKNVWNLTTGDMELSGDVTLSGGRIQDASGKSWWDLGTGDMNLDWTPPGMEDDVQAALDAANAALEEARQASDEASDAAWDATMARNVTNRISFSSKGMQVVGTDGTKSYVATYGSRGLAIDDASGYVTCQGARLAINRWGVSFENAAGTARFWITEGSSSVVGPEVHIQAGNDLLMIKNGGMTFNGREVALK